MDRARRIIWKLWNTPIDWEAVAAAQPGKGWRPNKATIEKRKATRLRNRLAKQRAATERRAVEIERQRKRPAKHGSVHARVVSVMAPGEWYTRPVIIALTGIDKSTLAGAFAHMVVKGIIERRELPKQKHAPGYQVRLTARGMALRAWALRDSV